MDAEGIKLCGTVLVENIHGARQLHLFVSSALGHGVQQPLQRPAGICGLVWRSRHVPVMKINLARLLNTDLPLARCWQHFLEVKIAQKGEYEIVNLVEAALRE